MNCSKMLTCKNFDFWRFPRVLKGLNSSGRLVEITSIYPGIRISATTGTSKC